MFSSRTERAQASRLRPLLFLAAAVATLFLFDRTGAFVLQAIIYQSDQRNARAYAGGRSDDVLILGSSVGNAMTNPVTLGQTIDEEVFSLASHGLDALTQRALLQDYLARNAPPAIALLDVRPARGTLVRAPTYSLYAGSDTHMRRLIEETRGSIVAWDEIFHLYRFNSEKLPNALLKLVDRKDQATSASDGDITPAIIEAWTSRNPKRESLEPVQVESFIESVGLLQAAGTEPVVILPPLHPSARHQLAIVEEVVLPRLPEGILVCDFTEAVGADRFYEDPAHLNAAGREAMLPHFVSAIAMAQGRGESPDCRFSGS